MRKRFLLGFVLSMALPVAATAMAAGTLELRMEALQEIQAVGKDGKKQKKTVPAARVVPGSEVIYVITYRNVGDQPADKAVITNPVPKEMAYKGGSGSGKGAVMEVSVDGGTNYGPLPSLRVKGADGAMRPAQAPDVTHVRWTLAKAVAPGQQGSVSYRAILK